MNWQLLNIVIGIVGFSLFIIIQSLVINGIHYCFKFNCTDDIKTGLTCGGNIFYKLAPKFFQKHKGQTWTLPLYACVKCQSSVWGTITFWSVIIPLLGFKPFEIIVWIFDMFALVSANWIIYKKI